MTESDWLSCDDPARMLDHHQWVDGPWPYPWTNERKLRLFADTGCALCQRFLESIREPYRMAEYVAGASCGTRAEKAAILRDIFGNPFRKVTFWKSRISNTLLDFPINDCFLRWNDRLVPRLAQGIYDERAFDRMPILADALEEAGCTNEDILMHCRGLEFVDDRTWATEPLRGQHVRGCWVIDLLLGKE